MIFILDEIDTVFRPRDTRRGVTVGFARHFYARPLRRFHVERSHQQLWTPGTESPDLYFDVALGGSRQILSQTREHAVVAVFHAIQTQRRSL